MIGLETSREGKNRSSYLPPDVVSLCHVSRPYVLCSITSYVSLRYNKQLIAQLIGRHEDLSPPRNFMSPSGDMNFLGGTNLHVSLQTGQLMYIVNTIVQSFIYSSLAFYPSTQNPCLSSTTSHLSPHTIPANHRNNSHIPHYCLILKYKRLWQQPRFSCKLYRSILLVDAG